MKSVFIFLILIVNISCVQHKSHTLPYELSEMGHFLIPISINGNPPLLGMFDTGAPTSVLRESDIKTYEIPLSGDSSFVSFMLLSKDILSLPHTVPVNFNIGLIKGQKIKFRCAEDIFYLNRSILGLDIINQFCWYFDTVNKLVTVSKNPIKIKEKDYIAIPYSKDNDRLITTLNMYGILNIENVFIDTGKGVINNGNDIFPIYLEIAENNPVIPGLVEHIGESDAIHPLNPDSETEVFTKLPLRNSMGQNDHTVEYHGIFLTRTEGTLTMDGHKFLGGYDGILGICYGGAFSALYLDTKNQIVYLKPN